MNRETELLEECRQAIRALQEENQQLRHSAMTFGRLAERLNVALRRAVIDERGPRRERSSDVDHHSAEDPEDR